MSAWKIAPLSRLCSLASCVILPKNRRLDSTRSRARASEAASAMGTRSKHSTSTACCCSEWTSSGAADGALSADAPSPAAPPTPDALAAALLLCAASQLISLRAPLGGLPLRGGLLRPGLPVRTGIFEALEG